MNNATSPQLPKIRTLKVRARKPSVVADLLYDIGDPSVFSDYHCQRVEVSPDEVYAMVERAKLNKRYGDNYIPFGVNPFNSQYFTCI